MFCFLKGASAVIRRKSAEMHDDIRKGPLTFSAYRNPLFLLVFKAALMTFDPRVSPQFTYCCLIRLHVGTLQNKTEGLKVQSWVD